MENIIFQIVILPQRDDASKYKLLWINVMVSPTSNYSTISCWICDLYIYIYIWERVNFGDFKKNYLK